MGGLGNQMFQYAAARSLADRTGRRLKLDLFDYHFDRLRRYELHGFQIRAEIAEREDVESLRMSTDRLSLTGRIWHRFMPVRSDSIFRERTMMYNGEIEDINRSVYLDGYWQSERYFVRNKRAVYEDFKLANDLDETNKQVLAKISSVQSVSLHVRRSDYITSRKTKQLLPVCEIDYYQKAVDHIAAKIPDAHFFVFSDDHEWVRRNLKFVHPSSLVTVNTADRGIRDMALMKMCRHHIIANSSFSWWGAWLNPSDEKVVVAPKNWFSGKLRFQTDDLVPSSWIKI